MKNNKLKTMGILSLCAVMVVAFASSFFLEVDAKSSAPASFTATSEKRLDGYIANYHFGKKKTSSGDYVYCNDIHKGTPHGETMTLVGEAPAGIAYILENGYPKKSITGNSDYDYYITQSAIWWYLDDVKGTSNLSSSFRTTGSDPHDLRKHVKELVRAAKKVTGYSKPSLSVNNSSKALRLSSDKKYYESEDISVTAKGVSKYSVSVSGAPSGMQIVNASTLKESKSFATNEKFKVRIPVEDVKAQEDNIKIKVSATGRINKAYEYKSSDSSVQNVYGSALYPETTNLSDSTTVTLSTSKVSIIKVDAKTAVALAGAEFTLYDSKGAKITSWSSTTKAHVIQNLPDGTYTLKETKAPKGYKAKKESIKFTIDEKNRDITIKVENEAITKLVNIVKIDKATGKPLVGAHLVVKNEKGEVIADFISEEEPYTLTELPDGKYSVYEEEAPNGYMKTEATYFFTISDNETVASVTVENEKIEEQKVEEEEKPQEEQEVFVPNTGSDDSILPTALGTVVLASGFGFVYYNGKKKKEQ